MRVALIAASCVLALAACATPAPPAAPPPIVMTELKDRVSCPAELDQPVPARPSPAADAVIQANGPGAAFVTALGAFADQLAAILNDAKSQCPRSVL